MKMYPLPLLTVFCMRSTSAWLASSAPRQHRASLTTRNVVFTRLSEESLGALQTAQEMASTLNKPCVDDPCLLVGVCESSTPSIESTMEHFRMNKNDFRTVLDGLQQPTSSSTSPRLSDFRSNEKVELPYDTKLQLTLSTAGKISSDMGAPEIRPEHILLSLLNYKEDAVGNAEAASRSDDCPAMEIMYHLDATLEGEDVCSTLLQALMQEKKSSGKATITKQTEAKVIEKPDRDRAAARSLLADCGLDLTGEAEAGNLDPVHGRAVEIQACFQTLVRRRKNNVCLIGEAGVGKTSIAEAVAQILVDEDKCPVFLQGYRMISLEVAALTAGTKYRGEFEARLRDIIEELLSTNQPTILFIDEIHTLVGAGASGDGAMDASNILKPYLSKGKLRLMGATTITEYGRFIAKDAALERRFQPVLIQEPTIPETVEILRAIIPFYRAHHRVEFTDSSLEAAARLSERYIADRFLPDKAIDMIDQAGALATLNRQRDALEAPEVTETEITNLISQWTKIPVGKLEMDEMERLRQLEASIGERVKGQERPITTVAKAIRRARTGIRNPKRPIASLLFCGPTGTGKTELCKTLAESYFGSERDLLRIDMSEFMEKSAVTRLTGPPPGFVGYEEGGQLTEAVRRAPHSVLLLDELEKAHPDVLNILLQVMEDGILTDGKGQSVSFKNTILIMTSNIGSARLLQELDSCRLDYCDITALVQGELESLLQPEFLNRIDDIVVFEPLTEEELSQIAYSMVAELAQRAQVERQLELVVDDKLLIRMVEEGSLSSAQFGARPMRRAVQRVLEDGISDAVVQGFLQQGDTAQFSLGQEDADGDGYDVVVTRSRDEESMNIYVEKSRRDLDQQFKTNTREERITETATLNGGDPQSEPLMETSQ